MGIRNRIKAAQSENLRYRMAANIAIEIVFCTRQIKTTPKQKTAHLNAVSYKIVARYINVLLI